MTNFEIIDDAAMDQVKGGLSFSLGFDSSTGISVGSPLGSLSLPNPITLATDAIQSITGKLGEFLTKFAGKLTDLGQLFDFS